ncbi:hypothetical protein N7461_007704 [Penicillium sp. DV-2018c]|nr:hypothetical protein N7461_007704 [Penicillium sp. DV-2018c]
MENSEDETREQIAKSLSDTPYACSSFSALSGGVSNFVYRGVLSGTASTIVVKHTKSYLASNVNFKLDAARCEFEAATLQALRSLSFYSQDNFTVKPPLLLHFDRKTNTQVLEDLPSSIDLKHYLLSEISNGVSESTAKSLGRALGGWLRSLHSWADKAEQAEFKAMLGTHQVMKDLKFYVNYTMLMDTIENFPGLLEETRGVFDEVRNYAAAESKREDHDDGYGIIHGDFWTGNVLIPNVHLTGQSETTLFIVDWEMSHIGSRALDLGQMIAELYETKLFKDVDAGLWVIRGLLEGYGSLSNEIAFRTAIHVGVHLVCWGSRVPGWGSPQQIEDVVTLRVDLGMDTFIGKTFYDLFLFQLLSRCPVAEIGDSGVERATEEDSTAEGATSRKYPTASFDLTPDSYADARNQYFAWKRFLRDGISRYSRVEQENLAQFWKGALEILEGDSRENHQFLAKDLVDDDLHGYDLILATANADNPEGKRSIAAYDEPFLKVITHGSLVNCLSIDSFVGTLYAFFGGTNGDRAIRYLSVFCQNLMDRSEHPGKTAPVISLDMVKLLLNTLYQLLSRVRRARFHDELHILLDLSRELSSKMTERCSKADLDGLESRVGVMRSLVNSANRNLVTPREHEEDPQKTRPILSSFPMDMQIPGGRHDNDLADISQIRILPTHGEIVSGNAEYLPSTNFLQPHFLADPLERYIDSTFRLLRHDVFGPEKDVLRDLQQQNDLTGRLYLPGKDSGARLYLGARIQHIFINEKKGLEATVSFSSPPQLRKMGRKEQCKWWEDSSRLDEGSLICFLTSQGPHRRLIFLEVTAKNTSQNQADQNKSSLVSDSHPPSITVKLAECLEQELKFLCQLYSENLTGVLVEFHGLIPATFVPILENLQQIQREGDLAFRQWVLPGQMGDNGGPNIPPPAYARKPGFIFPLTSITNLTAGDVSLDPSSPESIDILKLQTQTGLDYGQCQGLIAALTREYALIQGPPGTGKSYLGVKIVQALLEIKKTAKLNPIIVMCYTNHALDQFLNHLLDVGIEKIIRMGGRSQAPELEGKNLRDVSKHIGKTPVESRMLSASYGGHEDCMKAAGYAMKPLHQSRKGPSWAAMSNFVGKKWPRIFEQLERPDPEGFTKVTDDKLLDWLGVKSMRAQEGLNEGEVDGVRLEGLTRAAQEDIHSLSIPDRQVLAMDWFRQWLESATASLFEATHCAARFRDDINVVHEEVNRRALIQADVIGITTTSLARHIKTLRRIGTKVVICEEAAEVMEAHVISALMPGVEHFIQIGDHRQLRPQIQNHSLSLETSTGKAWQLDRSQFERRALGEPGLKPAPIAQLNVQRRMRPEISQLIRSVYPKLEDHESVTTLPNIVGMRDNLFWLDHRCYEDSRDDGSRVKSHSNQWEVDMATALVRHLVRQGKYKSTDIALLTPYTGQLRKLRTSLSKDFEICLSERDQETLAADGFENVEDEVPEPNDRKALEKKTLLQTLRLATVDNFQGEEAKVIVVSLVRSNSNRKVGFLRTENRINVLLSRAQHGMYLIGNAQTYLNVPMWADVHSQLSRANAVGTELALCCPRHPDTPILVSEPHDFERKSPEGGCSLPCTRRLDPCGHQCQAKCHSAVMHDGFACGKPCERIRSTCGHQCPKLCGEDCGPCMTKIQDVELPCGHIKDVVFCHQMSNLKVLKCNVQVEKTVPKHAPHASRDAPGLATTKVPAQCPARRHATDFLAISGALRILNACGDKGDARVDFIEWKKYSEIDLDETPIIVLGCGHFFTSESVDGVVGLDQVYTRDKDGNFEDLRDVSSSLASVIPSCPDCKQPIRQFVTKRYNRVVNRAVMDETYKRFISKGRIDLEDIESRLSDIEHKLNSNLAGDAKSKPDVLYETCRRLGAEALKLSGIMEAENQPMKRLMDAITISQKQQGDEITSLSARVEAMNLATRDPDSQITLNARLIQIKSQEMMFSLSCKAAESNESGKTRSILVFFMLSQSLKNCRDLIAQANERNLYRIVILATISFAKIAQLDAWWYRRTHPAGTPVDPPPKESNASLEKPEDRTETTRELLTAALKLCDRLGNCPELQEQVQELTRLYEGPRYETVTLEELRSIKSAMVSGRGGFATHSGHWYNCVNGHPFAIGECGMPMEQARCPECGAPIGGQNHTAVEGVSRALQME